MAKYYFFYLLMVFPILLNGQSITRLTDQRNPGYFSNGRMLVFGNKAYHVFFDLDYQIEVWDFKSSKKIYQTDIDFCDNEFIGFKIVDSLIISFFSKKMIFYNYLNSEQEEKVYPNNLEIAKNESQIYNFRIHNQILDFNEYLEVLYDFVLRKFVKKPEGTIIYRSDKYYYIEREENGIRQVVKSLFNDTLLNPIPVLSSFKRIIYVRDKLFFQDSVGALSFLDKSDSIKKIGDNTGKIKVILEVDDDRICVLGSINDSDYVKTINIKTGSLEVNKSFDSDYEFTNPYYYNGKLFFEKNFELYFYNFSDSTINKIDRDFRNYKHQDSLILSFPNYAFPDKFIVLNSNTMEIKEIFLPESRSLNFKFYSANNKFYIYYDKKGEGLRIYQYDFDRNTIKKNNYDIHKNGGLGFNRLIQFYNTLYVLNDNDYQILDESEEGNLDIFSVEKEKLFNDVFFYNNNAYYLYKDSICSNSNMICLKLYKYDIKTNEKKLLMDNISFPDKYVSRFKIKVFGRYVVIQIKPYEKLVLVDSETDEIVDLPDFKKSLIYSRYVETQNYIFSYSNAGGMYRVSKDGKFDYVKIGKYRIDNWTHIEKDQFVFSYIDTLFYCDGLKVKPIYTEDQIHIFSGKVSPNKRYVVQEYWKNGSHHYLVYDRTNDEIIVNKPFPLDISIGYHEILINNDHLYLHGVINNERNTIYSYDFKTGLFAEKHFTKQPCIISISDKEVHIFSNHKIYITDSNLNVFDSIYNKFNGRLYNFGLFFSKITPLIEYSLQKKSVLIYNREKRELKKFFYCEDSLNLFDAKFMDDKLYCTAFNDKLGMQLYRIDFNNTSNTHNVSDSNVKTNLELFPNPCLDFINLKQPISNYKVISAGGKLVLSGGSKTNKIDISTLIPGMYYVISTEDNEVKIGKFVKMQ